MADCVVVYTPGLLASGGSAEPEQVIFTNGLNVVSRRKVYLTADQSRDDLGCHGKGCHPGHPDGATRHL